MKIHQQRTCSHLRIETLRSVCRDCVLAYREAPAVELVSPAQAVAAVLHAPSGVVPELQSDLVSIGAALPAQQVDSLAPQSIWSRKGSNR